MLSASSSIITFDIYKSYLRKNADHRELIRFGRCTALIVLVLAAGIAYFFLKNLQEGIFKYIQEYWAFAYPSICALFLAGFFYKRANARGSLIAILAGPLWAILFKIAETVELVPTIPFLTRALVDFLLVWLILWIFRTRGDRLPEQAVVDRSLPPEAAAALQEIAWYRSFRFWSLLLVAAVVALYVVFF
jgi:solute:Na+ symporter, SSS family